MIKHTPIKFSDIALFIALKSSGGIFVSPQDLNYRRAYFKKTNNNRTVEISINEYQKLVQTTKTELFKGLIINDTIKIIRKNDRTSDGKPTGKLHYSPHILAYGTYVQNNKIYSKEILVPVSYDTVESRFLKCLTNTAKSLTIESTTVAESIIIQTLLANISKLYSLVPQYTDQEIKASSNAAKFYLNLQTKLDAFEAKENIIATIKANLPEDAETKYKQLYKHYRALCNGADETKILIFLNSQYRIALIKSLPETNDTNILVKRNAEIEEQESVKRLILPD